MFIYLVSIIIFLCVLHILFNYNERARMLRKIPGPKEDFLLGNSLLLMRISTVGIMEFGRESAKKWKRIYRFWGYPYGAVVIYNPKDIEVSIHWNKNIEKLNPEVAIVSNTKFNEKSVVYKMVRPWLQDGLLLSDGAKWQERRKILTPAFHFNILRQFSQIIQENTEHLLEKLDQNVGKSIDVVPLITELTLNSICETAMRTQFTTNTSQAGRDYKNAVYSLGHVVMKRFTNLFYVSDIIFNLSHLGRAQKRFLQILHNFTENVVNKRRQYIQENGINNTFDSIEENNDVYVYKKKRKVAMLDLLISAEMEGLIDKKGIQEEVDTFMFEGHDTTASGLTFCLMLLANHKEIQDKIVTELRETIGDADPVKMEDLTRLKYLDCCIKESLRMYPPVHFISRYLNEPTVLSDYDIPANTLCHIRIYDLHHSEELYPDPEKFDPDRFLPENSVGRHPFSYLPFSAGPRNCIGQKFAMMEMKIVVAEVLRKFELVADTTPADIKFIADLVLRNDGPVKVNFIKRQY